MRDRVCPSCEGRNPELARFCMDCGTRLLADDATIAQALPDASGVQGERRIVTVMFADVSGFTSYSESVDVEDVHALAEATADKLGEIVERYGGYVDKVIGDCVMAVFGAPTSNEDDPERGVRAALDMHAYVAEHSDSFARLPLTIGLNTGEVIWAPVGPGGRHTVLGDTVNTAARLQSAATKGQVLIGEATARAVGDAIVLDEVEPIKAKNKEEPVRAWNATGVSGVVAVARTSRTRLHGRDREMERLREIAATAFLERRPSLAMLLGPTGIGKTRAADEVCDEVGSDATVVRGRCLPYGEGITYWPVVEVIRSLAGIQHDDDTGETSAKLGGLLENLGTDDLDELRTMAVALAHLIGSPVTPRGTYTASEISRGELHWGVRRILQLRSRRTPVIVVFDDLQWADPTLFEFLAFLVSGAERAPFVVICAGLDDVKPLVDEHLVSMTNTRVFDLEALDDAAARDLVSELIGAREIDDVSLDHLVATAGGNPLFLEELAQSWIDASAGGEQVGTVGVPDSLAAVITARLDRLSPAELRVLSRAAVLGNVFWPGAVAALNGSDDALTAAVDMLEVRDLIRPRTGSAVGGEREYEFRHGLIREVAYARSTKAERVTLHARSADWLEGLAGGSDEFVEVIAFHLEQSCVLARDVESMQRSAPRLRAVTALRRAAERAESHEGTREADRFYARALDIVGDALPEARTDLRLRSARTSSLLGRHLDAIDELRAVSTDAVRVGRPDLACRALVNLADLQLTVGRYTDATNDLAEAERLSATLDDRTHLVRTAFVRAIVQSGLDGDSTAAIATLDHAVEISDDLRDPQLRLAAHFRLGTGHFNTGNLDRAGEEFELTAKLAAEIGSLQHQAIASRALALIGFQCGPREEAEPLARQVLVWVERMGDQILESEVYQLLGQFALADRDVDEAKEHFRSALELAADSQATAVDLHRYLAEVHWRTGHKGQARQAAEAAAALASDEDPQSRAMVRSAEGLAAAAAGDEAAARAHLAEAVTLLRKAELPIEAAEITALLGEVVSSFGHAADAYALLAEAKRGFADIGAPAMVADVERTLLSLSVH